MKRLRLIIDITVIISTSFLLGILAFDNLSKSSSSLLLNISLNTMHISLLAGCVVNIVYFSSAKRKRELLLTALPLFFLLLSFVGLIFDFRFPAITLVVFDFYLIFWFYYLVISETKPHRRE